MEIGLDFRRLVVAVKKYSTRVTVEFGEVVSIFGRNTIRDYFSFIVVVTFGQIIQNKARSMLLFSFCLKS